MPFLLHIKNKCVNLHYQHKSKQEININNIQNRVWNQRNSSYKRETYLQHGTT